MRNEVQLERRKVLKQWFQSLVVLMRILFGMRWLFAGVTKITGKYWFSEPGEYLRNYLLIALEQPNVPEFYKYFIENAALNHVYRILRLHQQKHGSYQPLFQ